MLRITTGTAKNKRLKIPEIEGFRGVQEIAKMSLFAILADKVKGAVCLDLFAGSGNLGLEALSRGASWCDFVDESSASALVIEENIHNCGFLEISQVYRKSAVKYVAGCEKKYDLVFMDPFYDDTSHKHLFKNIKNILNVHGRMFYFHKDGFDLNTMLLGTNLHVTDTRKFGESVFDEIVIG